MKSAKTSITKIYAQTVAAIAKNPKIYIPFIVFAGLEILSLLLIYCIPRQPFVTLMGPPVRTFWGSRFLHYPFFFLLMPKLASLTRMWLSVIAGSALTGIAVGFVYKKPARDALKKYISLFLLTLLLTALFYGINKLALWALVKYFSSGHAKLLFIGSRWWLGPIFTVGNFFMALVIQALFVYSIPALMCGARLATAIGRSIVFAVKHAPTTILLVGLPMLAYIPIIILNNNAPYLMDKLFPEIVLLIALAGACLTSLFIDAVVTVSTALVYQSSEK